MFEQKSVGFTAASSPKENALKGIFSADEIKNLYGKILDIFLNIFIRQTNTDNRTDVFPTLLVYEHKETVSQVIEHCEPQTEAKDGKPFVNTPRTVPLIHESQLCPLTDRGLPTETANNTFSCLDNRTVCMVFDVLCFLLFIVLFIYSLFN
ncbi:hypothetical protein [Bufonid herpesvirus 1]|uniref:hypothetical protein n=1 Tax=Bufonid herpesvirus 1 TaxID=2282206 RepID=UPI000EB69BE5|nr:hypothetical protein [Bufonid herpesvirus 1]AXF48653.1 hypothetical protein [Bufonid herpesvirus 1]